MEKRHEAAELTLTTGSMLSGYFFLADTIQGRVGGERVGDVLNREDGFFPFGTDSGISLINRAHVLKVILPATVIEAQLDAGYDAAKRVNATWLLTNGEDVSVLVTVYRPEGRDRLSDYLQLNDRFRYVELPDRTVLVNSTHIVAMSEVAE